MTYFSLEVMCLFGMFAEPHHRAILALTPPTLKDATTTRPGSELGRRLFMHRLHVLNH